jgi:hypothetical protein
MAAAAAAGTRNVRLIVHSGDRDRTLFPHAHNYELQLTHEVRDIVTAHLSRVSFPFVQYVVNASNASIQVSKPVGARPTAIQLPHGDYAVSDLLQTLQTRLSHALSDTGWSCTLHPRRGTCVIASDTGPPFTIHASPAAARLLGLTPGESPSTPAGDPPLQTVSAPFRPDLTSHVHAAVLTIPDFEVNRGNRDALHDSLAILTPLDNQRPTEPLAVKMFTPALWTLRRLRVTVTDIHGAEYDHCGLDHWFILDLQTLCRKHL